MGSSAGTESTWDKFRNSVKSEKKDEVLLIQQPIDGDEEPYIEDVDFEPQVFPKKQPVIPPIVQQQQHSRTVEAPPKQVLLRPEQPKDVVIKKHIAAKPTQAPAQINKAE